MVEVDSDLAARGAPAAVDELASPAPVAAARGAIELRSRGIPDVLREIRERMAGRPTYLCFDMDFFDPSCAPGVCTPAWGGVSAGEGLALIAALDGLRFVAFDINTVSPPRCRRHDRLSRRQLSASVSDPAV